MNQGLSHNQTRPDFKYTLTPTAIEVWAVNPQTETHPEHQALVFQTPALHPLGVPRACHLKKHPEVRNIFTQRAHSNGSQAKPPRDIRNCQEPRTISRFLPAVGICKTGAVSCGSGTE